jgi:hypothetical protein
MGQTGDPVLRVGRQHFALVNVPMFFRDVLAFEVVIARVPK